MVSSVEQRLRGKDIKSKKTKHGTLDEKKNIPVFKTQASLKNRGCCLF